MRKLMCFLLLLLLAFYCYSDVGDKFEAGGIAFGGGVGLQFNMYNPLDDESESNISLDLDFTPWISFLLIDNLEFQLRPRFEFYRRAYNDDYQYNRFTAGFSLGIYYAVIPSPRADKGIVFTFGGETGVSYSPGRNGTNAYGAEYVDDAYKLFSAYFSPGLRAYFFITDVIAPYVGVYTTFSLPIAEYHSNGVEYDAPLGDRIDIFTGLYFGMSFHIPNKDMVLNPKD